MPTVKQKTCQDFSAWALAQMTTIFYILRHQTQVPAEIPVFEGRSGVWKVLCDRFSGKYNKNVIK